jgi:hypothetical protein
VAVFALGSALLAPSVRGQTTTLTVTSGSTGQFPNPTADDYNAGYIDNPTPVGFSVALSSGNSKSRTTTVEVCTNRSTLGTGKVLSDLQWRPGDLSKPYTAILLGCAGPINSARVVGQGVLTKGESWSGSLVLRTLLHWSSDTQSAYGAPIQLVVTVTTP